jgi:hypothetical protein
MQYYLKDKKIDIYLGTKTVIKGVTTITYSLLHSGLWAYYRQNSGGTSLTSSMTLKVYDSTERVIFVISRRKALRLRDLSLLKVRYNGRTYEIDRIDNFEDYTDDYKLECHYDSTKSYNGIPTE